MDLTQRQKIIFKTLVEQFTYVAEPIGSKALIPLLKFPVSSATVRNELAVLEKAGLLEKTHTSSGRVPSNLGYRYYVENLMELDLDPEMEDVLKQVFSRRHGSASDLIQTTCSILSEMTHLTSVVIGPLTSSQKLAAISLIPVDETQAVAVFVTSSGHTEHRIFQFEEKISLSDLKTCTELLNSELAGTQLDHIVERMQAIKPLMAARVARHEVLFEAFISAFMRFSLQDSAVAGRANMLAQPEFHDRMKLEEILQVLDNTTLFHAWTENPDNVSVPVGKRNELIQIGDCSVVSARFKTGNDQEGQLMVIGPNRMPYSRVMALMDCMSEQIEEMFFTKKQGGSKDEQKGQPEES